MNINCISNEGFSRLDRFRFYFELYLMYPIWLHVVLYSYVIRTVVSKNILMRLILYGWPDQIKTTIHLRLNQFIYQVRCEIGKAYHIFQLPEMDQFVHIAAQQWPHDVKIWPRFKFFISYKTFSGQVHLADAIVGQVI